jgi:hypothetical protein
MPSLKIYRLEDQEKDLKLAYNLKLSAEYNARLSHIQDKRHFAYVDLVRELESNFAPGTVKRFESEERAKLGIRDRQHHAQPPAVKLSPFTVDMQLNETFNPFT